MRYEIEGIPAGRPLPPGEHQVTYSGLGQLPGGEPVMRFRYAGRLPGSRDDREEQPAVTVGGLDGGDPVFETRFPRYRVETADADGLITKMARVVAALLRSGSLCQGDLGMRLDPESDEGWEQQAERWLRS